MASNSTSQDQSNDSYRLVQAELYAVYANAGPSSDLIIPATVLYLIAMCGVTMNSFVIYVTVKTKTLRAGSANVLVTMICAFEVMHQSGHTFFFIVVVSGSNFVRLIVADLVLAPMLFGANAVMIAMVGAAFDRLMAVAMPFKHKKLSTDYRLAYLGGHFFVYALFGLYSLYYVLDFGFHNPNIPTTGVISEILQGPPGDKFFMFTTILNIVCIVCYVLIWVLIRCKNGVSKETNTRLLRSLIVIMLVSVGGYLINLSIYQLLFLFASKLGNPNRLWQLGFLAGYLLNMGAAANAPILYLNSTEYRKVFKRELSRLAKLCSRRGTSTTTISVEGSPARAFYPTTHHAHPQQSSQIPASPQRGVTHNKPSSSQQSIDINRY